MILLGSFAQKETEKREDEEHSEVCNYYACACREIVGIVGYRYTDNVADAGNNRRADCDTAEAPEYLIEVSAGNIIRLEIRRHP